MVAVDAAFLKDDAVLQEIVERIVKTLHPTRIYLFGSQARGDATQDSDYDLMVLVDHPPSRSTACRKKGTARFAASPRRSMSWSGRGQGSMRVSTSRHRSRLLWLERAGCFMSLDPQKVLECRSWLDRAWSDLDSAGILLNADRARTDAAVFHCQQAADKAWKAFLFWHDAPFRRTHELRELGEASISIDPSLSGLAERAEDLSQFAWLFRYPGDAAEPPMEEAEEALALAQEVYEAVLARIPAEDHP